MKTATILVAVFCHFVNISCLSAYFCLKIAANVAYGFKLDEF